jgi:hypothetical protein
MNISILIFTAALAAIHAARVLTRDDMNMYVQAINKLGTALS